jgi:prevent-host-death family protein
MDVTATEAKNRLGHVLERAQREPVFIEKSGRRHSVVLSVEQYERLVDAQRPMRDDDAGKRFYERYKDWVDLQNEHFETHGVFGEEWRLW